MVSNTHFWDPDAGDEASFTYLDISYSNAFKKAKKYINGGYELRVPYPANGIIEAYDAPPDLFQFYRDGQIFYKGYYQIATGEFITRNYWSTTSLYFRDKVVWEILGRICHLIGDMTVPAHVHDDPHPPTDPDGYENWMKETSVYTQWTYLDAVTQGGLIDPLSSADPMKYLFYPTAQIANFFSSVDANGNISTGINDPFSDYPGLSEMIQYLNDYFGGPPDHTVHYHTGTSDNAFVYGIRAMAGFLYWFTVESDLLPIPITGVSISGNSTLYSEFTGHWYIQPENGIAPFTYNWEIMYTDGGGYLESYEDVRKRRIKRINTKKTKRKMTYGLRQLHQKNGFRSVQIQSFSKNRIILMTYGIFT